MIGHRLTQSKRNATHWNAMHAIENAPAKKLAPKKNAQRYADAVAAFASMPPEALIRVPVAAQLIGVCEATVYAMFNSKALARVKPTANVTCVRVGDLREFLRKKAAQ
jgi:hypothetical protein